MLAKYKHHDFDVLSSLGNKYIENIAIQILNIMI